MPKLQKEGVPPLFLNSYPLFLWTTILALITSHMELLTQMGGAVLDIETQAALQMARHARQSTKCSSRQVQCIQTVTFNIEEGLCN